MSDTTILSATSPVAMTKNALKSLPLKTLPLAIAVAALSPFSVMQANASSLMEEVVVTAQKREENLQTVPISISAFSGDALKEMGAESVSDLGRATAGVSMNNESVTQPAYNVRGIQTDDFTVGSDPAVALYVDGVYAARGAGAEIPLDDVERIEILKGPQGTLFGRNATGGAINYITKKPSLEGQEGSVTGSLGNFDRKKLDFSYNTPLTDTLAIRVGGSVNRRDGYLENANGRDLNDIDRQSFRASILWEPNDKAQILWRGEYSDMSQGSGTVTTTTESVYNAGVYDEPYDLYGDISTDVQSLEERDLFGTSLEFNYFFDNATFTSLTAWRSMNVNFINDEDGSSDPGHYFASENIDDQDQFSQEFRLTGDTENLKWTLGATYSREHVDHTTDVISNTSTLENFAIFSGLLDNIDAFAPFGFPGAVLGLDNNSTDKQIAEVVNSVRALEDANGVQGLSLAQFLGGLTGLDPFTLLPDIQGNLTEDPNWMESVHNTGTYESTAIYGDATYSVTENLNITAGLRYTYDEKEFTVDTGYNPNNYLFINPLTSQPQPMGLFFYNNGLDGGNVPQKYSDDWGALSGRFVVDYMFDDGTLVYGSVATGFKSGGFNSLSFGPGVEPSFDQEEVTNYELGYKSEFMDGKMRFNASAYFYQYDNKQDLNLIGSPIPSYNITTLDAEGKGVDMELYWSVTDQWFVSANYSYIKTEITGYDVILNEEDETGESLTNTPENSFYLMTEYTIPFDSAGDLVLRADYSWVDEADGSFRDRLDSYDRINARATFNSASDSWSASLWVNNLTDEEDIRDFVGPGGALGSYTVARRLPRMYGLDVTYRF
ncbi:TonB-dependent receptor [Pseudomaricurvus sp.]|uniref:TonB-dependent receptor n=1 Tax=Pseudomaricurvus sp. TaxID=2004510 RepID=UPI003F6C9210